MIVGGAGAALLVVMALVLWATRPAKDTPTEEVASAQPPEKAAQPTDSRRQPAEEPAAHAKPAEPGELPEGKPPAEKPPIEKIPPPVESDVPEKPQFVKTEPEPPPRRKPTPKAKPKPKQAPEREPPAKPPPLPVEKPQKLPPPDDAAVAGALKDAREIFKQECVRPDSAGAKRVLQKAVETDKDPLSRFVLLRLARDIAVAASDGRTAFDAIEHLGNSFAVDALAMKADVLAEFAKAARSPLVHRAVCEQIVAVMGDAIAQEDLTVAKQLGKLAQAELAKVRDKALAQLIRDRNLELKQAIKTFAEVEAARETLREKPDDAGANLTVGRYLCFAKGDWQQGLPCLAKGGDAGLSRAAQEDLKAPQDPAVQLKLADAWWDLGAKTQGTEQGALYLRAGHWYEQVLRATTVELARLKIEKRLEEIAKISRTMPGRPGAKMPSLVVNSLGMKLAYIPAGEFMMGSPDSDTLVEFSEKPQHRVRITRPFYMGVYEVTQGEFQRVTGINPNSYAPLAPGAVRAGTEDTSRHPAGRVSWAQAAEFCLRLSQLPEERRAGRVYRLPTEAQWEYACRAGTTTTWSFGNNAATMVDYAWTGRNANGTTHPVGEKKPNPWGLYDMHGNVSEWCMDWYDETYYRASPVDDPQGPAVGRRRVTRGGDLYCIDAISRSAWRSAESVTITYAGTGFRVVMIPPR